MAMMKDCIGMKGMRIRNHLLVNESLNSLRAVNPAQCAWVQLYGVVWLALFVEQQKMMHSRLALMKGQYLKRVTGTWKGPGSK